MRNQLLQANHKYYEMCENDADTFTVHYGRMGGIRTTVTFPMAQWDKKFREKVAQGYVANPAVESVTDPYTLKLIRRLMGLDAHRLDAVFSICNTAANLAFDTHVRQQTNRKTLALWHGSFRAEGYLAIYEVYVGNQLDAVRQEPRYLTLRADALQHIDSRYLPAVVRQNATSHQDDFIIQDPAQCTIRYIVRIKA